MRSRTKAWALAATKAVGWPRATSMAKLGPLKAPPLNEGLTAWATSWGKGPPSSGAKPLHTHTTGVAPMCGAKLSKVPRSAATGVANTNKSKPGNKSATGPWLMCKALGKATPGRYWVLQRSRCKAWAWTGLRAHSTTWCCCAALMANAVPQAPAPTTATFMLWVLTPTSVRAQWLIERRGWPLLAGPAARTWPGS